MLNAAVKIKMNTRGFTLLEILLAIFILGVVLTTVYASYSSSLRVIHDVADEQEIYKMARISLDRLTKDLSSLQRSKGDFFLQAERDMLEGREFQALKFWSAAHLDFEEKAVTQRPAIISYFVRKNEESETFSLIRGDAPGVAPEPGKDEKRGFVICENLETWKLRFYDERGREAATWDTLSASSEQKGKAPIAVKVEMALANKNNAENPYKFTTTIFLPARK